MTLYQTHTSKEASSSSTRVLFPCTLFAVLAKLCWPGPPGPPTGCWAGGCWPGNIPPMDDAILIWMLHSLYSACAHGSYLVRLAKIIFFQIFNKYVEICLYIFFINLFMYRLWLSVTFHSSVLGSVYIPPTGRKEAQIKFEILFMIE